MAYQPKSYRKFITGAATAALVASSFAGVAGAAANFTDVNDRYQDAVDYLVAKGIKGISETEFGTQQNIKRVDAAVFVVKALGLDVDKAPDSGFTDVPERAVKEVNALKEAGITSGKSATSFGAQDLITRGELAIWLTKAFELEGTADISKFTDATGIYTDAIEVLVAKEITSGTSATTFGTKDNAKRGDFAIFVKKAADAVVPVAEPVVKSVSAINAKELQVQFGAAVDADTLLDNGGTSDDSTDDTLLDNIIELDDVPLNDGYSASLSGDGKTLTIVAADGAPFDGTYKFEFLKETVKTVDGKYIAPLATTFKIDDQTRPTITEVKYEDNVTARVYFSEPIAESGTATFEYSDGKDVTAGGVTQEALVAGEKYIEFTIDPANVKAGKEIVIKFNGVTDYNGNVIKPASTNIKYDNTDKTEPTISSITVKSPTTFDVKLSEGASAVDATLITVNGEAAASATVDSKDKTVLHVTAASEQTTTVPVAFAEGAVTDLSGNGNETVSKLVNFKVDTTAPQVVSTSVVRVGGSENLIVTFNENVTPGTADLEFSYTGENGVDSTIDKADVVPVLYKAVDGKSKSVAIDLGEAGVDLLNNKDYTVTLDKGLVTDLFANESVEKKDVTFKTSTIAGVENKLTATISDADEDSTPGVIVVTFDQQVDATSAKNKVNYTVEDATIKEIKLTVNAVDGASVQIVLNEDTVDPSGYYNVTVKNVKPYSTTSRVMDDTSKLVDITENVRATVKSVEPISFAASSVVNVTFSEDVVDGEDSATTDYVLYVSGKEVTGSEVTATEVTGKVITFSINKDLSDEIDAGKSVKLVAKSTLDIADTNGNKIKTDDIIISK